MSEAERGLLDTSVVIDHDLVDPSRLPAGSAISAVTLAELAAGPHATDDDEERARRQDRLQWAASTWDPLPFDAAAARVYGRVFAAARASGGSHGPRPRRPGDRVGRIRRQRVALYPEPRRLRGTRRVLQIEAV